MLSSEPERTVCQAKEMKSHRILQRHGCLRVHKSGHHEERAAWTEGCVVLQKKLFAQHIVCLHWKSKAIFEGRIKSWLLYKYNRLSVEVTGLPSKQSAAVQA